MSFIIDDNPEFEWPVRVSVPDTRAPGKIRTESFTITVSYNELLATDELEQLKDSDLSVSEQIERITAATRDLAMRSIIGWSDIKSGKGKDRQDVAFSAAMLEKLMDRPAVFSGIRQALVELRNGQEAKTGN